MNIIAMAFISVGYALGYWGTAQIKFWNKNVFDTEAPTLKILMGFPPGKDYQSIHSIPFPIEPGSGTGTGTTPSSNSSNGNGANLSPNYPGGPGGTIPTPKIPGVSQI